MADARRARIAARLDRRSHGRGRRDIETSTVAAAIAAADAACKVADVTIRDVRLAVDLAGKAYFTMTGTLDSIEAAAGAALDAIVAPRADRLVGLEVIAQPSPDLRGRLFR